MTERVPRWREVADALIKGIRDGVYAPGDQLPTENDLARHFRLNRHTVRRAFEDMAAAGLIRTERGRGSFVRDDMLEYRIHSRPRFTELMRSHDQPATRRTLSLRLLPAGDIHEAEIATEVFGIRTHLILLERVGYARERPVSYSRHIFDPTLDDGLLDSLRSNDSITEALGRLGIESLRRRTRVSARLPDTHEATLLRMSPSEPLLCTVGSNVTPAGRPIEMSIAHYPARRMQLLFDREANDGAKPVKHAATLV